MSCLRTDFDETDRDVQIRTLGDEKQYGKVQVFKSEKIWTNRNPFNNLVKTFFCFSESECMAIIIYFYFKVFWNIKTKYLGGGSHEVSGPFCSYRSLKKTFLSDLNTEKLKYELSCC